MVHTSSKKVYGLKKMVNCLSSDIFTHFATPFSIFNVYYSLFNDYYFNTLTCDKQGLSINIFVKII